jgi:hypothetical protein
MRRCRAVVATHVVENGCRERTDAVDGPRPDLGKEVVEPLLLG